MFLTDRVFTNNIAVINEEGICLTYSELENYSSKIKNSIHQKKCLAVVLCDYSIETFKLYYALLSCEVVPLLLESKSKMHFVTNIIKVYRPKYIWIKSSDIQHFKKFRSIFFEGEYSLLESTYEIYSINLDVALLLSTSGSTGSPKFVRLSYKNIYSNTTAMVDTLGITSQSRLITTLPMNYAYGLSLIHMHLLVGATIIITNKNITDNEFWQLYFKENPTFIGGVPHTYLHLDKLGFFNKKQPSLKHLIFSGGRADFKTQQKLSITQQENDYKVHIMYGQTEATFISGLPPFWVSNKYDCVGLPIKNVQVSLKTSHTKYGELLVKSDGVFMGYSLSYKELSLPDQNNGKLYTGDIACLDEDGCIYLKGRINRYCKLASVRVNLDDIEVLIRDNFSNIDIACIGEDNTLYIFYTGDNINDNIKNFLSRTIDIYKGMIYPIQVNDILRNERGKIQYSNLKNHIESLLPE